MTHLPHLIEDLGLILMAAATVTLIFKRLKQPVVLGYLIAGFIVGPHFKFLPSVQDPTNVSIWAEIGVIFMLFGLGLEFSFKKLAKVGKSASITALFEILAMLGAGYLAGQLLNWSKMDSLFLGGILSISSTTIIVRAFDELGLKGKNFVSLVFGVLVVEDLIAILLLVLLSSVAATQTLSGVELAISSLRLGFFLVLWFLLGIYLLPIFLKKTRDLLSNETLLVVSIGLCLMMVVIATKAGFSPALGAFVMGSILAETPKGHQIERLILPVKDLFSAVFFVSVGMLINPHVLVEYWDVILLMSAITIIGKTLSTSLGALISGQSIRSSVQSGLSLAQIGEFSFIIATLGMTLKVTSPFLYPIAVTISAVTTFSTPYLIQVSGPLAEWVERKLPVGIKESLSRYEITMSTNSDASVLTLLWHEYGLKILLNMVVVIAITLLFGGLIIPNLGDAFQFGAVTIVECAFVLILCAPFLWAIFLGKPAHTGAYKADVVEQLRRLQFGIVVVRFLIGCSLIAFVVSCFTSMLAVSGILLITVTALVIFFFSRFSEPIYKRIERRFISNLTANERAEIELKAKIPVLAPWNANLVEFTVSANSPLIAKTLQDSGIKEQFGVTVAMIERGGHRIHAPKRGDLLLPGDKVFVIGTEDQLLAVRPVIEKAPALDVTHSSHFGLSSLVLTDRYPFVGKSIRDCGLREAVEGLIVGIEREGQRYLSPDSNMTLLPGDLVWLVGDKNLVKGLLKGAEA